MTVSPQVPRGLSLCVEWGANLPASHGRLCGGAEALTALSGGVVTPLACGTTEI